METLSPPIPERQGARQQRCELSVEREVSKVLRAVSAPFCWGKLDSDSRALSALPRAQNSFPWENQSAGFYYFIYFLWPFLSFILVHPSFNNIKPHIVLQDLKDLFCDCDGLLANFGETGLLCFVLESF